MGHSHTHSAAGKNKRRLTIVLALTSTYLIAEIVGGLLTQSLALLADAGHMLTDVAGIALALIAIRFAERPATPERTYGYYRVRFLQLWSMLSFSLEFHFISFTRHMTASATHLKFRVAACWL